MLIIFFDLFPYLLGEFFLFIGQNQLKGLLGFAKGTVRQLLLQHTFRYCKLAFRILQLLV
jgi:hypothetical protein